MKNIFYFTIAIICLHPIILNAQKKPNIQTESLVILLNNKIDGKLLEFNNSLQAYNKATQIEYTVANNSDNIYLAIRSTDVGTTAKILAGGITFVINPPGIKPSLAPALTVPLTNSGFTVSSSGSVKQNYPVLTDSAAILAAIKELKFIKVENLKGLNESTLSIYNESGIETKINYYSNQLICEVLIPRNLIGITQQIKSFAYQIKLNGVPFPSSTITGISPPPPAAGTPISSIKQIASDIHYPTDLKGSYVLAN